MFKKISIIQPAFSSISILLYTAGLKNHYSTTFEVLLHFLWPNITENKSQSLIFEREYIINCAGHSLTFQALATMIDMTLQKKAICYVQNSFVFKYSMWPMGLQKLLELYTCTAIVKCKRKGKREEGWTGEGRLDEEESGDVMKGDERGEEWRGVARTRGVDRNGEGRKGRRGKKRVPESFTWSTGNLGSWTRFNLPFKGQYTVMCFRKFFTSWKNKKKTHLHCTHEIDL